MAVSHIMLEAYKKYILVALMLHGKVFVLITGRNEVVAKVIFLHLFVILFTGRGVSSKENPPARENPPCQEEPPGRENPPPPGNRPPPPLPGRTPPPGSRLQHTVNERPVRILLECILVVCKLINKKLNL